MKAAKIENINPTLCGEHRNVFLVCGTNDLRVSEKPVINELVSKMIGKIKQIRLLNPNSNIFVVPVLPTRDRAMNRNIILYNSRLLSWIKSNSHIDKSIIMPPVYSFLDSSGLLASRLTRDGDSIHLGSVGMSRFVSMIKSLVYKHLDFGKSSNVRRQYTPPTNRAGSTKPA